MGFGIQRITTTVRVVNMWLPADIGLCCRLRLVSQIKEYILTSTCADQLPMKLSKGLGLGLVMVTVAMVAPVHYLAFGLILNESCNQ